MAYQNTTTRTVQLEPYFSFKCKDSDVTQNSYNNRNTAIVELLEINQGKIQTHLFKYCDMTPKSLNSEVRINVHF
jgi:hypothetical protein